MTGVQTCALPISNADTIAALKEAEDMKAHPDKYPSYGTIEELKAALEE